MARVYVNLGKADGFYAGNLIDMLNKNVHGQRVDVGRIDLLPAYSLFDVRKADAHRVVSALKNSNSSAKGCTAKSPIPTATTQVRVNPAGNQKSGNKRLHLCKII